MHGFQSKNKFLIFNKRKNVLIGEDDLSDNRGRAVISGKKH